MLSQHFQPWQESRPCWHCSHFAGVDVSASAAQCRLPMAPRLRSQPERGCSAFEREIGADDEVDWSPLQVQSQGARVWRPKDAPPVRAVTRWAP